MFLSGGYTAQAILNDFKKWSGGFAPDEVDDEYIEEYIEAAIPSPVAETIHIAFNDFGEYDQTGQYFMELLGY